MCWISPRACPRKIWTVRMSVHGLQNKFLGRHKIQIDHDLCLYHTCIILSRIVWRYD